MNEEINKVLSALQELAGQLHRKAEFIQKEPLHDQLRFLRLTRDFTESVGDIKTQLQGNLDTLRQETIPTSFKESGTTSQTVDGYRYTLSQTLRASIKAGAKEKAFEWLRENDLESIITETVNASTLSAQARQMMTEGLELDPDLFNVAVFPSTSITQAK